MFGAVFLKSGNFLSDPGLKVEKGVVTLLEAARSLLERRLFQVELIQDFGVSILRCTRGLLWQALILDRRDNRQGLVADVHRPSVV